MKKKKSYNGIMFLIAFITFVLLFTYSSLNLKNIDYGYKLQEVTNTESYLKEEIDKLIATKAYLLNIERVEKIVIERLGYQYPDASQFIKVFED